MTKRFSIALGEPFKRFRLRRNLQGKSKIGKEVVQEVAKVANASTAKVVDDVAGLQRGRPQSNERGAEGHRIHMDAAGWIITSGWVTDQ